MNLFVLIVFVFPFTQTNGHKRHYFYIMSKVHPQLVLDASYTKVGKVVMWEKHVKLHDWQLWFWDDDNHDILRNKKYPKKVKKGFIWCIRTPE